MITIKGIPGRGLVYWSIVSALFVGPSHYKRGYLAPEVQRNTSYPVPDTRRYIKERVKQTMITPNHNMGDI